MKLLRLVSLFLLTWSGTTFADQHAVVTVAVEEGSDAILPCSLSTEQNIEKMVFDWKKRGQKDEGQKEVFFYDAGKHYNKGRTGQDEQFKTRVFHFEEELKNGNASIKVQKTKMADSGNYTCTFPNKQISHITLVVDPDPESFVLKDRSEENIPGAARKPSVTILNTEEGMLLQCEVHGASPKPKVEWKDSSGNIVPAKEPQVSERGGSYDIILQATVTKTDNFCCVVTQEEIKHQTHTDIYAPLNGAAREPFVKIIGQTEDGVLLQCVVRGASPKPKVEWRDSSGNIVPAKEPKVSERGGSYDISLNTTVTKTDNYRCVATQEEINHQTHSETFVPVNESSTGWMIVAAVFITLFVFLVAVGILLAVLYRMDVINLNHSPQNERVPTAENGNDAQPLKPSNETSNTSV